MRRYTAEEKDNALKLAEEIGAPKAAEQLGISYASMLDWRKKANAVQAPEELPEAPEAQAVVEPSASNDFPLELRVRLLQQENDQLRAQLARQTNAIHALTPKE